MSFFVIYRNDFARYFTVQSGPHPTVEAARNARQVSGDIVTDSQFIPITNEDWLWDWEKELANCYAKRIITSVRAGDFIRGNGFDRGNAHVFFNFSPVKA